MHPEKLRARVCVPDTHRGQGLKLLQAQIPLCVCVCVKICALRLVPVVAPDVEVGGCCVSGKIKRSAIRALLSAPCQGSKQKKNSCIFSPAIHFFFFLNSAADLMRPGRAKTTTGTLQNEKDFIIDLLVRCSWGISCDLSSAEAPTTALPQRFTGVCIKDSNLQI